MIIAVYDCETTGIIRGHDYTNPDNPHLASIAIVLYDDTVGRIIASFNAPIYPVNWVMPPEAGEVNGLTTEYLQEHGLPFDVVMQITSELFGKANLCVAHNADFDQKMIASSMWRFYSLHDCNEDVAHTLIQQWNQVPHYCTMKESEPIVQALDKRGRIKFPKLTEAYKHFFDRELSSSHSANADAVACLEIYLALRAQSNIDTYVGAE